MDASSSWRAVQPWSPENQANSPATLLAGGGAFPPEEAYTIADEKPVPKGLSSEELSSPIRLFCELFQGEKDQRMSKTW